MRHLAFVVFATSMTLLPRPVLADADCPIEKPGCVTGKYFEVIEKNADCKRRCSVEPPPPPELECFGMNGSYDCEAWAQGKGMRYSWYVEGGMLGQEPYSASPYQSFICGHTSTGTARLWLTTTSPYGTYSQGSFVVSCPADSVPQ